MIRPRWHKIFSDLLSHKGRSLLIIASIATGLFAIGMITTSYVILAEDIRSGYRAVNPPNIQLFTMFFDRDYLNRIRKIDGVRQAEGVWNTNLQIRNTAGEWEPITVKASDYGRMGAKEMGQPHVLEGIWPPDEKQIALDINRLSDAGAKLGDTVEIKLPSGVIRRMPVVGIVRDQTIGSSRTEGGFFLAGIQGYTNIDTLRWLGQPEGYNTLYVRVETEDQENKPAIRAVADRLIDDFDKNGYPVNGFITHLSSEHPNLPYVDAMAAVIYLLGFLVVFLSGFLITNTFSALLNQQVEQIGVMKTVGGSRGQIVAMYMVLILVFSLIALAVAIPLSNKAAYMLLEYISVHINFQVIELRFVPASSILQTIVALLVPQLAGIIPILQGTRISVREALSGAASNQNETTGFMYRLLAKFRGFSRPILISLRNTFRRRGRLALTLITLMLGGATFIATFNVRNSISSYIDRLGRYFLADVNLTLDRPYRLERVAADVMQVQGVAMVEGWNGAFASVVTEDGKAGETVQVVAPPKDSKLIEPILLRGRWLMPDDRNAITLSELFLESYPEIDVGDTLRLKIGMDESDWEIVGLFQFAGRSSGLFAYVNYDDLARETGMQGKSTSFRIVASDTTLDLAGQKELASRVEAHLSSLNYKIKDVGTGLSLGDKTSQGLSVLTTFLLIMSLLMASVGSIGLAGTMSLNVMERTHEIGVMRAIGGSNRAIITIVLVEGIAIGLISWLLASLVALPISKQLADIMFQIIFDRSADVVFTLSGNFIWLGIVLVLSTLAGSAPAFNASRLTIREVLAYE